MATTRSALHIDKFAKLGQLFKTLTKQLKQKAQYKVKRGQTNGIVEHQLIRPNGAEVPSKIQMQPSYITHPDVKSPKLGDTVYKRLHHDGHPKDRFTATKEGKPLGAETGDIPKDLRGLLDLPDNYTEHLIEGWPNLNYEYKLNRFAKDFQNFADARPIILPPGTKIYRIVDEMANNSGAYWAYELPKSKTEWRKKFAVKDSWNDNGYYVEHTVEKEGLKVWGGTVAGQRYLNSDYYLKGGGKQLFITPNTIKTTSPKLTNWTELK